MKKVTIVLFISVLISFLFLPVFGKGVEGFGGGNELEKKKENIEQKKLGEQTQREAEAQKANVIKEEPELIWQKDFGEEIRQTKFHKTIGPSDFPIMAVETDNNFFVFDRKGNDLKRAIPKYELKDKKETHRGFVQISDNGEYILEGEWIAEILAQLKYTTVQGRKLWEKKDFYGSTAISPNGDVVTLLNTEGGKDKKGCVEFYNRAGKLLKQYSMDLSSLAEMAYYAFSFSKDGNYFVLRLEQWKEDKKDKKAIYPVILFNKKGELLWQKEIEVRPGKTPLFQLLISAHGNLIAYSGDNYICVVNKDGKLLWKKEPYSLLYSFSDNEDLVAIGEYESFNIAKASNGEEVWPTTQGYSVISPDGALLAVITSISELNEKKLTVHIARILDKKSKLILKTTYLHPSKIKFKFSADSKYLYYMEREKTKVAVFRIDITKFCRN